MNLHILSMNAWLYSTRRLIEEAQHYGHQLQVISYKNVLCPSASPVLPDAVVPRIAANMTSNGLAAIRAYESMGIKSTLSSTTLELVRNKFACLQKLNSEGIPTPKTELVHEHTNLEQLFKQEFRFPVVLKLAESTHGLGVFLVHNKRELRRMLRSNRHIRPLLLQEFIREAAGCDIRAFVIGEQVVASMKRSATSGDFRANLHRGGRAKSIQLSTVQANLVVKTAKVLDIPIAGIDLLMSARGLLVIEANASPGLEGIERVSGRNIARGILRYVSSK